MRLRPLFECRAYVMKTVPVFLRGRFRANQERGDEQKQERGWKLVFLLPRMLLSRPCRGGLVPRKKLEASVRDVPLRTINVVDRRQQEVSSKAASARNR